MFDTFFSSLCFSVWTHCAFAAVDIFLSPPSPSTFYFDLAQRGVHGVIHRSLSSLIPSPSPSHSISQLNRNIHAVIFFRDPLLLVQGGKIISTTVFVSTSKYCFYLVYLRIPWHHFSSQQSQYMQTSVSLFETYFRSNGTILR
jgi:hypothetical protein